MSVFAAPVRLLARTLAAATTYLPTSLKTTTTTTRSFCATTMSLSGKLKPAARVSGQKQDVW